MPTDNDPNVQIESGGITFNVATEAINFYGATAHFQYMKVAYGPTGSVSLVSSSNGLPVNVIAGGITANLVGFCGAIQGIPGGTPVVVSGTVYAQGVTSAPVFVRTFTGSQVEVTGGRSLSKSTDNISVFGPGGVTWVYTNLVNSSGTEIGNSGNPLFVNIAGDTINAVVNATVGVTNDSASSALRIQGLSGGTSVPVTVGNTVTVNDTAILSSLSGISNSLGTLNTNLSTLGISVPTSFKNGRTSSTFPTVQQLDSSGFTIQNFVKIKALSTNTDFIYIGNTGSFVGSSVGYALDPGDEAELKITNTNKVYVVSASGTQVVTYLAS